MVMNKIIIGRITSTISMYLKASLIPPNKIYIIKDDIIKESKIPIAATVAALNMSILLSPE